MDELPIKETDLIVRDCLKCSKVGDRYTIENHSTSSKTFYVSGMDTDRLQSKPGGYFNCNITGQAKQDQFKVGEVWTVIRVGLFNPVKSTCNESVLWLRKVEPQTDLINCKGCGQSCSITINTAYGAKDPESFCTLACEDRYRMANVKVVNCVTPWMGYEVGDLFKPTGPGHYALSGCQWVHRIGDDQPANIDQILEPDTTYRVLNVANPETLTKGVSTWEIEKVIKGAAQTVMASVKDPNTYAVKASELKPVFKNSQQVDQGGVIMNGQVYTGHVVRTKTIQAGDGVTTGIAKSEIIFTTQRPIVAAGVAAAKNIILALSARQDGKLDLENPAELLEVVVVAAS